MKKRSILNLIKYHAEHNDAAFRNEAYSVARDFDAAGDYQLAEYVMALLSDAQSFVPQDNTDDFSSEFMRYVSQSNTPLPLPEAIAADVKGIVNAIGRNAGLNKFIFQGSPGTGKTETAKRIAQILERELLMVDFSSIIDSKLGQTSKNLVALFNEINQMPFPERHIVLFDELDALALDRVDSKDLREMGRSTSIFLRELDEVSPQIVIIATTNLYKKLDKAITRRFDYTINFDRYSREDLAEVAEKLTNMYIDKFGYASKNNRLLAKIIRTSENVPYPGDLSNIIKMAIAFTDPDNGYSYLRRIYEALNDKEPDMRDLQEKKFTVREIEILTGIPKSTVAREVKEQS